MRGGRAAPVRAFFLLLFTALFATSPASAVTVTDDAGAELNLERPAQRVISLSPHLTEMMYAIGAGTHLVGAVRGSDFPVEAASLPQVGDASGLDFERIVASRPDLLLAWGSGNRSIDIARLRSLGLKVLVLEPRRLEDIPRHLGLLGEITGQREQARVQSRKFESQVQGLRQRYAGRVRLRVLFVIWYQPLFTINGDHIISKVLELCAAENIFAGLPRLASEVALEQVLLLDPDAIVMGSEAASVGAANWAAFPHLKAVRNGNVFRISADLITRQTPRIVQAAELLCADLDQARR